VRIQDLLGKFHDATEVIDRYRALRDKWKRARRRSQWRRKPQAQFTWKELRSGLKFVERSFGVQAEKSRAEFERLWPEFIGAGFCKPFERLLRELQSQCAGPRTDASAEGGPRVVPTEI